MHVQSSPLRHLTKSHLCVVQLEAPDNTQPNITFLLLVWILPLFPRAEHMRKRLASDVDWPPLDEILYMAEHPSIHPSCQCHDKTG
jgi:hypothetical protein